MARNLTSVTPTAVPCRTGGCAGLCTDEGMAAAHARYRGRLLARARRVVVDPALADDAVQEAFVRAWRACASFDPATGPLVNWLLVITGNVAIDMVKARTRRPPVASAVADDVAPGTTGDIDRVILRAQLREALSRIGARHRQVVVETIVRDRPYTEVAAELGVPAATLRTRVHHALRRLRAELGSPAAVV